MKDYLEKRREELSKREEGFTLMEMLIVVAIIAVLIAIAIPIFTSQLENSREATDAANIRSKYAEVAAEGMTSNTFTGDKVVKHQQNVNGWANNQVLGQSIGEYVVTDSGDSNVITFNGNDWTLDWDSGIQKVTISNG